MARIDSDTCICGSLGDDFDGVWELVGSELSITGADVRLATHDKRCPKFDITSASPAGPADLADWIDSDYLRRHPELLDELDKLSDLADDIDNDKRGLDFTLGREPF